MPSSDQRDRRRKWWRICVPVLLIGLLLYNPFLALTAQSDGLSYQALARHRATVGASELQSFSPVQVENTHIEVAVEAILFGRVTENAGQRFHLVPNDTLPQRPELDRKVWFRPPPAA